MLQSDDNEMDHPSSSIVITSNYCENKKQAKSLLFSERRQGNPLWASNITPSSQISILVVIEGSFMVVGLGREDKATKGTAALPVLQKRLMTALFELFAKAITAFQQLRAGSTRHSNPIQSNVTKISVTCLTPIRYPGPPILPPHNNAPFPCVASTWSPLPPYNTPLSIFPFL